MSVTFLIGLPRSGKSSYAQQWITEMSTNGPRIVVSDDELRLALYGQRYNSFAEPMIHAMKQVIVRKYHNMGYDVLVDDTHTTKESILRLLRIDEDAKPVIIDTSRVSCQVRALDTGQDDLVPVIERMWNNLIQTGVVYNWVAGHPKGAIVSHTMQEWRWDTDLEFMEPLREYVRNERSSAGKIVD